MARHATRMAKPPTLQAILALILTAAPGGCTSPGIAIPFWGKTQTVDVAEQPARDSQAQTRVPGRYPLARLKKQLQDQQLAQADGKDRWGKLPGAETAGKMSTAMRRAAGALAPSPRVTPANDPTRLTSPAGPLGPEVFVSSARLFEQKGNVEKAAEHYQKALQVDTDNRQALIGYARLQHRLGNLPQAVELYQRVLDKDPRDAVALNDLGLCHARLGQVEQAVATLARAVQVSPTSERYRNNLASLLIEVGRQDEALEHLKQVLEPAKAHHNLACLLWQHGDEHLAAEHFAWALQFNPSLEASRTMLAEMQRRPEPVLARQTQPSMPPVHSTADRAAGNGPGSSLQGSSPNGYVPSHMSISEPVTPSSPAPGPSASPEFLQRQAQRIGPFGYDPYPRGIGSTAVRQVSAQTVLQMPQRHADVPSTDAAIPPEPSPLSLDSVAP